MGRGGRDISNDEPIRTRPDTDLTEVLTVVSRVTGLGADAAETALRARGLRGDAASIPVAVAAILAEAWDADPRAVVTRLLPTTLLEKPRRQRLRTPAPESFISADDWRDLLKARGPRLAYWQERDWARWLNGLIRSRTDVEDDPPRRKAISRDVGPITNYVRTLFYAGR